MIIRPVNWQQMQQDTKWQWMQQEIRQQMQKDFINKCNKECLVHATTFRTPTILCNHNANQKDLHESKL